TNDWIHRSFDISEFRGRTIRIAFIERDLTSYFNLHLDDVSLVLEGAGALSFDVYFGTNAIPGAGDFQGTITNPAWQPESLALNTTYFWKIVERLGATATPGPVWSFRTRGVGPVHHFDWEALPPVVNLDQPFPAVLTARDDIGNVATNYSGAVQLSAI